jgi:hypothetical protein
MLSLLLALALQDPVAPPVLRSPNVQERLPTVNRIVRLKHADPAHVVMAFQIFQSSGLQMSSDKNFGIVTIVGPEREVAEMEKMIASFDVEAPPVPQIEFRVRLLGASENAEDDKRDRLNDEAKAVVAKLSKHFRLTAVWEIDSVLGRSSAGGQLALTAAGYLVRLSTEEKIGDKIGVTFNLNGDATLGTTLSIKPGETTVVGLTKSASGQSVIAVITATVEK